MITRSVSEARRQLSQLIQMAQNGEDVVIIKDSKPVAALRPVDESDLELLPEVTDEQFERLRLWALSQPGKTFSSAEDAVRYLKRQRRKKR